MTYEVVWSGRGPLPLPALKAGERPHRLDQDAARHTGVGLPDLAPEGQPRRERRLYTPSATQHTPCVSCGGRRTNRDRQHRHDQCSTCRGTAGNGAVVPEGTPRTHCPCGSELTKAERGRRLRRCVACREAREASGLVSAVRLCACGCGLPLEPGAHRTREYRSMCQRRRRAEKLAALYRARKAQRTEEAA